MYPHPRQLSMVEVVLRVHQNTNFSA